MMAAFRLDAARFLHTQSPLAVSCSWLVCFLIVSDGSTCSVQAWSDSPSGLVGLPSALCCRISPFSWLVFLSVHTCLYPRLLLHYTCASEFPRGWAWGWSIVEMDWCSFTSHLKTDVQCHTRGSSFLVIHIFYHQWVARVRLTIVAIGCGCRRRFELSRSGSAK